VQNATYGAARLRFRRPPGGGHFVFGLHHDPVLTLVALVVVVVLLIWLARR
jgi:hypothetical protein